MRGWIYDKNRDNTARYTLGREGAHTLFCFGINPSTAEPENLDNTLKSVERIAKRHQFDSWTMFNIYPQRATDPNNLHDVLDKRLHEQNIKYISKTLKGKKPIILAAWGTLIEKRPYLLRCLFDIHKVTNTEEVKWMQIGNPSQKGHPHHPLYLSNQSMMDTFDITSYLKDL